MVAKTDLKKTFEAYVDLANKMPTQTADNMLIAYGFYKQAMEGDNTCHRPSESSNVIQTFKHDAWMRLRGMSQEEAMEKYIEHITFLIELSKNEGFI